MNFDLSSVWDSNIGFMFDFSGSSGVYNEISIEAQFHTAPPTLQEVSFEHTYWRKARTNRPNNSSTR